MLTVTGVVSAGQTGADQGALRAAKALGLKTGGYAPHNWWTEEGSAPWLGPTYGLREGDMDDEARTEMNILISSGTAIFGPRTRGSNRVERLCMEHGKPLLWMVEFGSLNSRAKFRLWIARNKVTVLNVAGNAESRVKGIGERVEAFLLTVWGESHDHR